MASDERTRTADLVSLRVITQTSAVACIALANTAYLKRLLVSELALRVHRIAFPVVSEWCQREDISCLLRLRE